MFLYLIAGHENWGIAVRCFESHVEVLQDQLESLQGISISSKWNY